MRAAAFLHDGTNSLQMPERAPQVLNNASKRLRVLDCTLRDGGHINNGMFGEEVIKNVVKKLVEAGTDIIEVGFLWGTPCGTDNARYYSIADAKRILPAYKGTSRFSLMADFIDLEHLEPCDGTIEYIRLSFKRHRLEWGLNTARILMEKGYKVFINPVNCNVYTDEQYIDVIRQVNELKPYGFSIVDTFGVMRLRELTYRYSLVESNLDPDITIGLHLHENLGLAYSLAQHFIRMADPKRRIVIDGSLLGMGRVPGNLCIEQLMDHLNTEYGDTYKVEPVFDAIDDYIAPIKKKFPWGYAIPYALSAKYHLHRTYAEFLMSKWKLSTSDIERILAQISRDEAEMFNEAYIESLYRQYMSVETDDWEAFFGLKKRLEGRKILLIAPGSSINTNYGRILAYRDREQPLIIGIHCIPEFIKPDFVFYTNIKRYDVFSEKKDNALNIVTSNLTRYGKQRSGDFVLNYARLAYHGEDYCDDSVVMLLNLLKQIGVREVAAAGFDGITGGKGDFYISSLARDNVDAAYGEKVKAILAAHYLDMRICFLTDSYYRDYKESLKEEMKDGQ